VWRQGTRDSPPVNFDAGFRRDLTQGWLPRRSSNGSRLSTLDLAAPQRFTIGGGSQPQLAWLPPQASLAPDIDEAIPPAKPGSDRPLVARPNSWRPRDA
jgi:hypothetical protein